MCPPSHKDLVWIFRISGYPAAAARREHWLSEREGRPPTYNLSINSGRRRGMAEQDHDPDDVLGVGFVWLRRCSYPSFERRITRKG